MARIMCKIPLIQRLKNAPTRKKTTRDQCQHNSTQAVVYAEATY